MEDSKPPTGLTGNGDAACKSLNFTGDSNHRLLASAAESVLDVQMPVFRNKVEFFEAAIVAPVASAVAEGCVVRGWWSASHAVSSGMASPPAGAEAARDAARVCARVRVRPRRH